MSEERRVHLSRSARPAYQALAEFSKSVGAVADAAGIEPRLKELVQIHASQLNGCSYCVRVHVERAVAAGVSADVIAQLPVWRDSGVFSDRERASFELAEAHVFIHEDGVPDDVYNHVGGILSEQEYVALSWILVSINAFNRVAIAGRYAVPPRDDLADEDSDAAAGKAW
ncbi:AhpD family alkylhydroperoxidase [Microbacterium terrae]|uniref:Carboxymuconolactone decarboxylase family protein n=1 Tax=Microbacterium terrae TaxID=69369 RepID=A0A0M2HA78_9MICO|nr:carboxymuconolactone decarboxylase family protein [Microbacterium terrae]KJL43507.1 Carboxymuconolactone decarboxylase family protein [Microbacterium terrae]MBP1077887.1 AhpD family alkylhydroperoxidase [Microbacterium terrae]